MANEKEEVKQAATQETAAPSQPELTVQDLSALKTIIDVASQRGAFKPNEMVTVGQTYTKLENFLLAIQAQQSQAESATKGE